MILHFFFCDKNLHFSVTMIELQSLQYEIQEKEKQREELLLKLKVKLTQFILSDLDSSPHNSSLNCFINLSS